MTIRQVEWYEFDPSEAGHKVERFCGEPLIDSKNFQYYINKRVEA